MNMLFYTETLGLLAEAGTVGSIDHLGILLQRVATAPLPETPPTRTATEIRIIASVFAVVWVLVDLYAFQAIKTAFGKLARNKRNAIYLGYWSITVVGLVLFVINMSLDYEQTPRWFRWLVTAWSSMWVPAKLIVSFFLSVDDLIRLARWIKSFFVPKGTGAGGEQISRSQFIAQAALATGAIPVLATGWGIWKGAYAYRVEEVEVPIHNLPNGFNGLRILQLSDIHAGSFNNLEAVKRGVDMAMQQGADLFCFTGDLVNNIHTEVDDYFKVLQQLRAPLGAYSILGNHDYGTYASWLPVDEREQLVFKLINMHKELGWDILLNNHRLLQRNGDELVLLGVENWGTGRFPKKGDLDATVQGASHISQEVPRILMSHDPSHWDAQIRPQHPQVQLTMSGHTHGMQFGVEIPGFKWSPSQYRYKQWGGLYSEPTAAGHAQHIYVNRGFGFIGFPGRLGMPPEVTVLKLVRA